MAPKSHDGISNFSPFSVLFCIELPFFFHTIYTLILFKKKKKKHIYPFVPSLSSGDFKLPGVLWDDVGQVK